jgi:hypothetical protein
MTEAADGLAEGAAVVREGRRRLRVSPSRIPEAADGLA